jgi:hypothetical protein
LNSAAGLYADIVNAPNLFDGVLDPIYLGVDILDIEFYLDNMAEDTTLGD